MNTVREIAEILYKADSILVFPHTHMDGDALGSASALTSALRKLGKKAYVLIEDEIADNLMFLDRDCCVSVSGEEDPAGYVSGLLACEAQDISFCVDCGGADRFEKRAGIFEIGKTKVCVDHHRTTEPFADYNFIDAGSAACGEIIYEMIRELETISGIALADKETCEAIYAAIATDTGNFQYSNTTARSHTIAAALLDAGADCSGVCVSIYQNDSLARVKIKGIATEGMKLFAEGRAAMTKVTLSMLRETGAASGDTDGIIDVLRNIKGVEIAVFLREVPEGEIKASFRAKTTANVAGIAEKYGGGGHTKAAGCTLRMSMDEAEALMTAEVIKTLGQDD